MPEDTEQSTIVFLLWSNKHSAWWKAAGWGYTLDRAEAGRFTEEEAVRYVVNSSMCGLLSGVTCMVAAPDDWDQGVSLQLPYEPQPVDNVRLAFPASVTDLMPDYNAIPEDFRRGRGGARPWIKFQQQWFFKGLKGVDIRAKDGIDRAAALRHLSTIQGSFEPQHEHKEAAVAYLASLWLEPLEAGS